MKSTFFFLVALALSQFARAAEATLNIAVPSLPAAPAVDGTIDAREWSCAAQIGPLVRTTDGLAERQTTTVLVGRREQSFYLALRHDLPHHRPATESTAASAEALQKADYVSVTVTGKGNTKRTVVLWPGRTFGADWVCKSRITEGGWQAELSVPLDRADEAVTLTVERAELTVDPVPHRLTAALRFDDKHSLAVRVSEAGEFTQGKYQGLTVDLVNFGDKPLAIEWTALLQGQPQVRNTIEMKPHSRRALRLAMPAALGQYEVQYELGVAGAKYASGRFTFDAGGPMSIGVLPFFLWRDGAYVRTQVDHDRPTELTCQLLDPDGKSLSTAAPVSVPNASTVEQFVSFEKTKPGGYVVLVEAREGKEIFARRVQRVIKRPAPGWWEGQSRDLRAPPPPTVRPVVGREIYQLPIEYQAAGHLDPQAGTIEFWLRLEATTDNASNFQFPIFFLEDPRDRSERINFTYRQVWSAENFHFHIVTNGRLMDEELGAQLATIEDTAAVSKADSHNNRYPRTPRLKPGEWHHVALTWQGYPFPTITMYLDGKLVIRPERLEVPILYDLEACELQFVSAHLHTNITLDELRLSNVARTADEIARTASGQAPVTADIHTLLLDRFEEVVAIDGKQHTVAEIANRPDHSPGGQMQLLTHTEQVDGRFGKGIKTLKY